MDKFLFNGYLDNGYLDLGSQDFGDMMEDVSHSPSMEEVSETAVDFVSGPLSVYGQPSTPVQSPPPFTGADEFIDKFVAQSANSDLLTWDLINGDVISAIPWGVPLDEIQPRPTETIVAPAMIQYDLNPLVTVGSKIAATSEAVSVRRSRRKSELGHSRCTLTDTPVFVDTKPDVAELVQASRGRKRSQPVPSPSCKRIKKYELDEVEDPSVRNARAAKANREKKKQELLDLKSEILAKDQIIRNLTEDNKELAERLKKAELTIDRLNQQQQSSNGIVQVREEIAKYLACLIPTLGERFGQIPTVILAPGLMPPPAGTRCINTQFNLDRGTLTISSPGTTNTAMTTGAPTQSFSWTGGPNPSPQQ